MAPKRVAAFLRGVYGGLPRTVWLLALINWINRAGTMVMPFLSLYLAKELGFSTLFAGAALGLYGLGAIIGAWTGGWLSDRAGPLRTIAVSMCGGGLAFLAMEWLRSRAALAICIFCLGVVAELYRPAIASAVAAVCTTAQRGRAYALNRLAVNLGTSAGPAMGGFLAAVDYTWLFRVDGVTCLLAACLVATLPFPELRKRPADPSPTPGALLAKGSVWRDKPFLWFLLFVTLNTMVFFQVMSTYPIFLKEEYGLSEAHFGLLLTLNGGLIVAFEMALTHWLSERPTLRLIGFGVIFAGLGLAILPFGHGFAFAMLSTVIWTVGEMITSPFGSVYTAERADKGQRGAYMGLYHMAPATAYVLGPTLGAAVYQAFGPDALWLGCGVLSLALWLGFEGLHRRGQATETQNPD